MMSEEDARKGFEKMWSQWCKDHPDRLTRPHTPTEKPPARDAPGALRFEGVGVVSFGAFALCFRED